MNCKLQNKVCTNLVLRTAQKGPFEGQRFFGCNDYPMCTNIIPLNFDKETMNEKQYKIARAFGLFLGSTSFFYASYGVVYFNLREPAFLDYLLSSDSIVSKRYEEIGVTGAKIYDELFHHLFLIPTFEIKNYLINNFPETYINLYKKGPIYTLFGKVEDYEKFVVDENIILSYKDIESYDG